MSLLDRGYTGHEHLETVGLIHMNARLYDADLHRFLAPDKLIQEPFNSQNYNRYGYVLNNPLMFTDPSGDAFWVAVLIGAFVGGASAAIAGGDLGDILIGAVFGGAIGGVTYGITNVAAGGTFFGAAEASIGFSAGFAAGAAGGAAGGFLGGAISSWLDGNNFLDGFFNGVSGALYGGFSGGTISGISSGIRANRMGLNFWDGKSVSKRTLQLMIASGFDPNSPVNPTDANMIKARDAWIPDAPMDNIVNFTTENVPNNLQLKMDNAGAAGATRGMVRGGIFTGRSSVYLNKNLAFSSAKTLYYTMTHEFVHVSQYAILKGVSTSINSHAFSELKELSAYSLNSHLGDTNYGGFTAGEVRSLMKQFPNYFKKFQFHNFNWTKTVKFTNIEF